MNFQYWNYCNYYWLLLVWLLFWFHHRVIVGGFLNLRFTFSFELFFFAVHSSVLCFGVSAFVLLGSLKSAILFSVSVFHLCAIVHLSLFCLLFWRLVFVSCFLEFHFLLCNYPDRFQVCVITSSCVSLPSCFSVPISPQRIEAMQTHETFTCLPFWACK